MTTVHVVVPSTIDDPARPSGGNVYDRRVCDGLVAMGWSVHVHATPGPWPHPDSTARAALGRELAAVPDGEVALLDGLIACCTPDVVVPEARRLRLLVLVHMPLGGPVDDGAGPAGPAAAAECEVLSAAAAVVTTSRWTRRWLLQRYALDPGRVVVAEPGAEPAPLAAGSAEGGELLCVAAVTPGKGHDQLLAALARVADLAWRCTCVGALTLDPPFVEGLVRWARESGIADRVHFTGALGGPQLDRVYAASDLLLLASRFETYGMVVTEALARGIPAVMTSVGGLPEALGRDAAGARPGLLVECGDTQALAGAVRSWLVEEGLRDRLRAAAAGRRATLPPWSTTARRVAEALLR
ncbi:MAG TPA: glycosyltransferase family 4 protein [Intrasporangium sp.]|uniref:glycosyltransferase family 4 protein n=1 Tax=Intrasporangium sp. TaxID=1925024 RepID=UPI002D792A5A|nr:glycosyltransferase family 4 protein [Intrasporangium sp.]HET7400107.1 glycosyltransferase family 4 protein [Intrasporangium sp.]